MDILARYRLHRVVVAVQIALRPPRVRRRLAHQLCLERLVSPRGLWRIEHALLTVQSAPLAHRVVHERAAHSGSIVAPVDPRRLVLDLCPALALLLLFLQPVGQERQTPVPPRVDDHVQQLQLGVRPIVDHLALGLELLETLVVQPVAQHRIADFHPR